MSRFADKLKSALQVSQPSMGFFRNVTQTSHPRMLLVPQLALADMEVVLDMIKYTDAILLTCTKAIPVKTMKALVRAIGGVPLGVRFLGKPHPKPMDGVDFRVFALEDTLLLGDDDDCGNVLSVSLDLSDSFARMLNDLPVESVLVNISMTEALTWKDLMYLRRLGDLFAKPFLAQVPVSISEKEIKILWDIGVNALVVSWTSENQVAFTRLRDIIDGIALTPKRKWMKTHAIVPAVRCEDPRADADGDDDCYDD